ncbi:FAD-binding oxidoreductase [Sphingopyxis lindanitolerans]|uniref:FAD-binding oxidoreductase n=2 Tax=Sphingopyxis lindanitolerans TaxID=2054227 RepID=A0A2S8B0W3_9SPHN|nr:FAD-binding oxidoreductase [Sphingopyxis lindanitolerans]
MPSGRVYDLAVGPAPAVRSMSARSAMMADLAGLLDHRALVAPEDAPPYEQGYRYGAGCAASVVRPASIAELRAIVTYCCRNDIGFLVQGANSGLVGASTPDDSGDQLLINLTRMTGIEELDVLDRAATVLAGTRLSAVNAAAASHQLCFPIDLGADPTIGGMVATNTGGARMLRYGDVRRNLLGLEVVLADADATIVTDLAGLRKDNSGFDWKQIFVGTGGAFGIVTRARIELHHLPQRTTAALVVPRGQEAVPRIIALLETALGDGLTACEGMSRNAMRAAFDHHPSLRDPFGGRIPDYVLLVELGTSMPEAILPDLDAALAEAIGSALVGASPDIEDVLVGRPADFWAIRHSISDGIARSGQVIAFDIAVQRSKLPAFRSAALAMLASDFPQIQVCDFGHCGDGGDHFNLVWPTCDLPPEAERRPVIEALRGAIYDLVVFGFGGTYSAEHGVGPHNQEYYDRYKPEPARALSGRLQSMFDEKGLMGNVRL